MKKIIEYKPWIGDEEINYVIEVLKSGKLVSTHGKFVKMFEEELSKYLGVKHVIATSSGTTALHIALKCVDIGPGDEVLVPAFTFIATATSILHANAIPVFVDIDPETLNIDPNDIENRISDKTKAIIIVHIAGNPCEIDEVWKIANKYNLIVIEDCAQALGAEYKNRKVGTFGHISILSFYPTKTITTGEGGAVCTNVDNYAQKARLLINHGEISKYYHIELGYNYRMSELQGALGYAQIKKIDEILKRREEFAKTFIEELNPILNDLVHVQKIKPYAKHAWNLIQLILNIDKIRVSREKIIERLKEEGIYIFTIAYPRPLYENPIFKKLKGHGLGCPWSCKYYGKNIKYEKLKNVEWVCNRVLTVLISPLFTQDDAIYVARVFKKILIEYSGLS